ncbi:MAG: anthranilate synthase component I family protein [Candidatus Scalindua sp. AMX11]|nr:MAG: anthranilate synthase component I family protein [Candidatus Scalindua sp.]NOG83517.1 anthranilate synthase component I family protein [Planctomycetota bacterium]RZV72077.1 MAG: anthranilate synthase component I family protein [Candidatus Scalindua sp. SCAELEC01]TDE64372.1 MAG: anthranilate synthase component I family protein [Candidatus Scalindua sp. AMX11]GJQ59881.1 MAG: aminodeoxychorismate synthase, component I [Candidatus Scalindua sp.]
MTDQQTSKKNIVTIREIEKEVNLLQFFSFTQAHPKNFFLDSSLTNSSVGRYSFIGYDPFLTLLSKGREIVLQDRQGTVKRRGNPFDELRTLLDKFHVEENHDTLPFTGGAVGYFGYDLCHFIEHLPTNTIDDIKFPEMYFSFYDIIVTLDHLEKRCYIISVDFSPDTVKSTEKRVNHLTTLLTQASRIQEEPKIIEKTKRHKIISNFSKEEYLKTIDSIKQYICQGDIYQVNLSQRFQTQIDVPSHEIFRRLRNINPAPFSCYLKFDNKCVISSSPERFLSVRSESTRFDENGQRVERKVQTKPIKGTRPRFDNSAMNEKMKSNLLSSKKDDSELTMIVDMERNDLGKVCSYNTVKVTAIKELEEHPTVYHLVGTVEGILHPQNDVIDLIKATFPGGSITGVPKVRAMQIIDELEPTRRNVYTGSIGYLSFNGNIDLNIAIRTFLVKDNHIFFQVGGGIVADSHPEKEYEETLHKARALIDTLK